MIWHERWSIFYIVAISLPELGNLKSQYHELEIINLFPLIQRYSIA